VKKLTICGKSKKDIDTAMCEEKKAGKHGGMGARHQLL
jgi:hypothetical protein